MPQVSLNERLQHAEPACSVNTLVTVHFSDIEAVVADLLRGSSEARACVAWLKAPALCQAMPADSRVVVQSEPHLSASAFGPGVAVRKVGQMRGGAARPLMHNKFCLIKPIDGGPVRVLTGSFNWTRHSSTNLENLVVIDGPSDVVDAYACEFERIWSLARPVTRRARKRRSAAL